MSQLQRSFEFVRGVLALPPQAHGFIALLLGLSSTQNAAAQCTTVLEPGVPPASYYGSPMSGAAQTFVPAVTGQVCEIQHGVEGIVGVGSAAYRIYLVEAPGAGAPPTDYATNNLFSATGQTGFSSNSAFGRVAVTSGLVLNAGQRYALIITPNASGQLRWGGNNADAFTSGESYYLSGGWVASPGPLDLAFQLRGNAWPLGNDPCASATPAIIGSNSATLVGATIDGSPACGNSGDVWFSFTPPYSNVFVINACGSSVDVALALLSSCGATGVACTNCSSAPCSPATTCIGAPMTAGTTYYIRAASVTGATGPIKVNIGEVFPVFPAPPNDGVGGAIVVGNVTDMPFSTAGATTDSGYGCVSVLGIWYRYQPTCQGTVSVNTCGSAFDTQLAVFAGSPSSATLVAGTCNDDNGPACAGSSSSVTFSGNPCTEYYIRVGGALGARGSGNLTISCTATAPPNDLCADAIPLSPGTTINGTLVGATPSPVGTLVPVAMLGTDNKEDVWYSFTPACNGRATIDTCGAPCVGNRYDSVLAIFSGSCESTLNLMQASDDANCGTGYTQSSRILANLAGGVTYRIRVSRFVFDNAPVRNFALTLAFVPSAITNDAMCFATPVRCGSRAFTTCTATTSAEPSPGCSIFNDVWYAFKTPSCGGDVTVSTCGSPMDTVIAIYDGICATPVMIACNNDAPANSPCAGSAQSYVSFMAAPSTTYVVRVGAPSAGATGNGVLTITCPPTPATCPPLPPAPAVSRLFDISGRSSGAGWAFRLYIPCCFDLYVPSVAGVTPSTNPNPVFAQRIDEAALSLRFVQAINAACSQAPALARRIPYSAINNPTYGRFAVKAGHCGVIDPNTGLPFTAQLYVGPANTPISLLRKVDPSGQLPTTGPAAFNPSIFELEPLDPALDCNANGEDDLVDVLDGTSLDLNGNLIPDECDVPNPPKAYCSPGTSTNGCTPNISATGTPSASASSGYTLQITGLEGQKVGLIFYGTSGSQVNPWSINSLSYLCVLPPTQRIGIQNSGGTLNACDGAISEDFLAYCATHPGALGTPLTPGANVTAQAWYRDPPAPKTTNLSDAIDFMVMP